jgi:hypothetical protein
MRGQDSGTQNPLAARPSATVPNGGVFSQNFHDHSRSPMCSANRRESKPVTTMGHNP